MNFIEIMLVLIFWALVFISWILFTVTHTLRSFMRAIRPRSYTFNLPGGAVTHTPSPVKTTALKVATIMAIRYAIRRF